MGEDCISPATHRAFSTPLEMMAFIGEMRRLSGGKPPDSSCASGHPWEFLAICKAMVQTGIYPDFIVVDGNEAAPVRRAAGIHGPSGHADAEGVNFVHNALIGINARDRNQDRRRRQRLPPHSTWRARWRSAADWCNRRAVSCSLSAASNR